MPWSSLLQPASTRHRLGIHGTRETQAFPHDLSLHLQRFVFSISTPVQYVLEKLDLIHTALHFCDPIHSLFAITAGQYRHCFVVTSAALQQKCHHTCSSQNAQPQPHGDTTPRPHKRATTMQRQRQCLFPLLLQRRVWWMENLLLLADSFRIWYWSLGRWRSSVRRSRSIKESSKRSFL